MSPKSDGTLNGKTPGPTKLSSQEPVEASNLACAMLEEPMYRIIYNNNNNNSNNNNNDKNHSNDDDDDNRNNNDNNNLNIEQ